MIQLKKLFAGTKGLQPSEVKLMHIVPPILLESVLRTTVGLVNVAFLSRLSDATVSAVSISNQYIMMCMVIASAIATGSIVYINQTIGMGSIEKTGRMASVAVCANVTLGLLFGMVFLFFSRPFLSIMQMDEGMIYNAQMYMRIVGGTMAISSAETILSSISRSAGRTRAPLMINLTVNGVNVLGCYLVIFTPLGANLPGVMGVALVNVISRCCGLALSIYIVRGTLVKISLANLKPFPWTELKMAMSIGIPSGANNIAYSMSQLVTTALITQTGTLMVAAKTYVSNLVHYVALVGMACAQASTILIGYKLGAGDYDGVMALRRRVTRIALLSNMSFSVLLILVRVPLLRIFTQDETILTIAASIMLIDFFVEIGRALNNTLSGSLQACGDVTFQLIVNQASGWLVAVGGAYLLGIVAGWGLYGVWVAFALDEATRGLILLFRWRSQKWLGKAKLRREKLLREDAKGAQPNAVKL